MSDFAILDIGIHLAASKNAKYRESIRRYYQTLATFLQCNGLVERELLASDDLPSDTFRVMKSDLTDEGFEFLRKNLDRWTAKVENGNPIDDVSILEEALVEMRQ